MATLKDRWTQASVTLERMIREGKSPKAIKAQRTKAHNAQEAYWKAVETAWQKVQAGQKPERVAKRMGIRLEDLAEMVNR